VASCHQLWQTAAIPAGSRQRRTGTDLDRSGSMTAIFAIVIVSSAIAAMMIHLGQKLDA
jgi:hypothetical protein